MLDSSVVLFVLRINRKLHSKNTLIAVLDSIATDKLCANPEICEIFIYETINGISRWILSYHNGLIIKMSLHHLLRPPP